MVPASPLSPPWPERPLSRQGNPVRQNVQPQRWRCGRGQLERGVSALTIVGRADDRRGREVLAFAGHNRIPVRQFDPGSAGAAECAAVCAVDGTAADVTLGRDEVLAPTPAAIAEWQSLVLPVTEDRRCAGHEIRHALGHAAARDGP
ncbi:MAG: hypothetical protein MUD11_07140 [Rhodobacteraceae bacterium]|jgi:hypothetical protein|nr:hypothetical protein [Paracoccaceae bacterium]